MPDTNEETARFLMEHASRIREQLKGEGASIFSKSAAELGARTAVWQWLEIKKQLEQGGQND